uniref:Butyrophilin subfamily 2 member A1 n=1 Tax=Larimichthys crocea TaxID=215358 RepID=A0A0F8AVE1_LARCR
MFRVKDKRSLKAQLSFSSSVVVFYRTVGLLLLTQRSEGQFKVVGSPEPIATIAGDDIILPCHLNPAKEAVSMAVDWTRPDLTPRYVHVRRGGEDLLVGQNLMYEGRTSMFINKLKHGDTSLRLSNVKLSDAGKYRCFFPGRNIDTFVELVVGAVSSPVIVSINRASTGVVLQCESKGWYPEPEGFWLDAEGNLLSAGPPETVRGPDDLYTVSRRLTAEKSDNFPCRVQQKNIPQTRETHFYVPEDVLTAPSSSALYIFVVLSVVGFLLFSATFFVHWKLRKEKGQKKHHVCTTGEGEELVKERKEELQEVEKEQKDIIDRLSVMMEEMKKKLEIARENQKSQQEKVGKLKMDIENSIESLGFIARMIDGKKKKELEDKKTECEKCLQSIKNSLQETEDVITTITDWKKKIESVIEEINKQPEETKGQRDEIQLEKEEEMNKNTEAAPLTLCPDTEPNES